jgi:carboxyl-terminal processing protease
MIKMCFFRSARTVLFCFLFLSLFTQQVFSQNPAAKEQIQKLASAMQIIDLTYVDSVDMNNLVQKAIIESLQQLDPHSAYIPSDEVRKANEPLEGSFEGIGITFQMFYDTILVIAPVPGGPSDKLGIMAGDKIVKINGENSTGKSINNEWVMDHLRGPKGSIVTVSISRSGTKALIDYDIKRDKIPLNSIDATFIALQDIGYIRLNRFSKTSVDEFNESLNKLKALGMNKLILDLRGNSGGYLNIAVDLANEFLTAGKMIVYTQGLHSPRQEYDATGTGGFENGRLVVLIDEGSASASEIVSGAIQDWDRGIIIGRRSFGKGLVQRPFNLADGSVIRLTTARYYTPTGRCIQKPYKDGTDAYYNDFLERYKHGELVYADSIKFPDSLKYTTKRGRVVYGGGGIMPDLFIPWDSSMYSDYYRDLLRKGAINQFSVKYVNDNRGELLSKYPSIDDFKTKFFLDDVVMKEFFNTAEKDSVKYKEKDWDISAVLIKTQLKALIARNLWDINAYYKIMIGLDDAYKKAVEVLKSEELYRKFNVG